ncbi:cytochrome C oxidase subunit IV family protein [Flavobacterium sp.]|uniref:cytochrome C oxidase subunit IV family protein n=1 Tax=Flavobacterium sp. TaxID=239 RepID=UPI004048AE63
MKKQLTLIYGIVLLLTIATAILSKFSVHKTAALSILVISGVKFLLVAFHFMELRNANIFWKAILSIFLVFLIGIIALII